MSVKAPLYSALVFPGAGYFVLRLPMRGLVCAGITIASLAYVVHDIFARGLIDKTVALANRIVMGEVSADLVTLLSLLDFGPDPFGVELASWLLLGCWAYAIYDCWRLGERQDRALGR